MKIIDKKNIDNIFKLRNEKTQIIRIENKEIINIDKNDKLKITIHDDKIYEENITKYYNVKINKNFKNDKEYIDYMKFMFQAKHRPLNTVIKKKNNEENNDKIDNNQNDGCGCLKFLN